MAILEQIILPKETVSDDTNKVVEIFKASGELVSPGDILFTFETSKAAVDVEASVAGYVIHELALNTLVPVGAAIARVVDSPDSISPASSVTDKPEVFQTVEKSSVQITEKARKLISELGIDEGVFSALSLVREVDVINYASRSAERNFGPNDLVIVGSGGHAKMCIELLKHVGTFNVVGIIDNHLEPGSTVHQLPVLGSDATLSTLRSQGLTLAVNGVGTRKGCGPRKRVYEALVKLGYSLPALIHPSAFVEPTASLGQGVQVMMGALVGNDVKVGENVIVNSGAIVSHDSRIESHTHLAPGSILAGSVIIGASSLVGMGVTIFMGITVGERSVIPNGQHVFKNLEAAK